MPRVAFGASVVQSHHRPSSRRPAAAEAKNPSSPFAALLDAPLPPDRPDRGQPPRAGAATKADDAKVAVVGANSAAFAQLMRWA